MSNTLQIEAMMMYDNICHIAEPKEALEVIATLEPQMGWGIHPERVRAVAYAIWLSNHKSEWFTYYEQMLILFSQASGDKPVNIQDIVEKAGGVPDGWIPPMEYIKGKVVE